MCNVNIEDTIRRAIAMITYSNGFYIPTPVGIIIRIMKTCKHDRLQSTQKWCLAKYN